MEKYQVEPNIFHVLPAKTPREAVISHMQALYLNSQLRVFGRLHSLKFKKDWCRNVIEQGPRIIVGEIGSNPFLVAYLTNLIVVPSSDGESDTVHWVRTSGKQRNPKTLEIEDLGQAIPETTVVRYD